ncbi:coiled-coil domain containing protein 114 [Lycorma delicatula]|uniref:coiled-coil domain containing protein 114 n=1 Tax=Lycorma delicatula TaxID=130591 RepID=UPI003F50DCF5
MAQKPPQDDLEMKQMAQAELERLQRQYRVMEGDRSTYMSEMKIFLVRQRKIIDVLSKRKQNLTADISVQPAKRVMQTKTNAARNIVNNLELIESLNMKIKAEKVQITELKVQINKVNDEILKLNKTDVNELRVQEKKEEYKRTITALEDRLEVATRKLNSVIADNAGFRHEINHLLFERKIFHKFYLQMSKELIKSKQIMIDLIEQATNAFDQREETQEKLKGLKDRMKVECAIHAQEVRELIRHLENDEVLYEFLAIKGQKRVLADLEAKEALEKQQQIENIEQKIAVYNDMLEKIKKFSGENDVNRLAVGFLKQEEENFTLFNYVNELNSEVEALQEHVNELMLNIDEQRTINRERAAQQEETLTSLHITLKQKKVIVLEAQKHLEKLDIILKTLMSGIERVFYRCKCNYSPILALVGENPSINIYNVMLCISVLEKYVIHLLEVINLV